MTEVTKVSSKGQIVIPYDIRKELGLDIGSNMVVSTANDLVILKKVTLPDPRKEFMELSRWGKEFARKKGLKQKDVEKLIHESRGIK